MSTFLAAGDSALPSPLWPSRRVVFFLQGEHVPAARVRGQAIVAGLRRAGLACESRIPYPSVYGDTRLPGPLRRAGHAVGSHTYSHRKLSSRPSTTQRPPTRAV